MLPFRRQLLDFCGVQNSEENAQNSENKKERNRKLLLRAFSNQTFREKAKRSLHRIYELRILPK